MNSSVFALRCWAANRDTIAVLANIGRVSCDEMESALQDALATLLQESAALGFAGGEEDQPLTKAETAPEQGPAQKARPESSSSRPRTSKVKNAAGQLAESPARKSIAKKLGEFADYPPALQNPLAQKGRRIYDYLKVEPLDLSQIVALAERDGFETQNIYQWASDGLYAMQRNGLVVRPEKPGGKWSLA